VTLGHHPVQASERCPVWIWGVIGVEECSEKATRFQSLMQQIQGFVTHLVVKLALDENACRTACIQLGQRHRCALAVALMIRDYFDEGYQQPYFDSFALAIRDAIMELVVVHVRTMEDDRLTGRRSSARRRRRTR